MRPRKQILLWSETEAIGEEYSFLLRTRSLCLVNYHTDVDGFIAAMADPARNYDLVMLIAGNDQNQVAALSVLSARRVIHIPTLIVLAERASRRVDFLAEQVLHFPVTTPQMFEAVATLCARKRGPKKLQTKATSELVRS